ncbi:hypothetical protein BDV95DRAFT_440076, partial [Massariosphaeria phaeospora]
FQNKYKSCKSAKIMSDPITGMARDCRSTNMSTNSKLHTAISGLPDEQEQQKALTEMQGVYCGNRPMRISTATPK